MRKNRCLIAFVAMLVAAVMFFPGGALAHHRPDHENGKPSPEPTSEPSPEPTPTPVMVNVELRVDIPVGWRGPSHELNRCHVVVIEGANGLQVLDAAVATGCIESYETEWGSPWPWGSERWLRLRCVDDLCDQTFTLAGVATRWWTGPNMALDDGFATEGAVMEAMYTKWVCPYVPNFGCVLL